VRKARHAPRPNNVPTHKSHTHPTRTRAAFHGHPEERKIWHLLSRYRPRFTRQLPIGPYIADFACRQAKLVVEIDGGQHAQSKRDMVRDEWLRREGWTVFRLWNSDVHENPIGTAEAILARAAECLGGTHPQPLPSREGRTRRPIA
jgi:very-short-patch-repair endonuclease